MKKRWGIFSLWIFILAGLAPLYGKGFIMQKNIEVAADEVQNTVISFGGTISVLGKVEANVIAFGGNIIIEGDVDDTVLGIGSQIKLKPGAVIKGDVICLGGLLQKSPEAVIQGDIINLEMKNPSDIKRFFREGLGGLFGVSLIPFLLIIKLISLFVWLVFAVALAGIFPRQLAYASSQIRVRFWPITGLGILSIMIFALLVAMAALLSLILIGIPILIVLVIFGIFIKVFGRVVLFYFLGDSLLAAKGKKPANSMTRVLLGFVLVGVISFIPLLGALVTFLLSVIGWGVVILTKFGTRENWFKKAVS